MSADMMYYGTHMEFYKCSSASTIIEHDIHCGTCDKYYVVASVKHICNKEMRCTRRYDPPTLTNITVRCVDPDAVYSQKTCLDCIERERAANAPTYNKCAGCGYQGWYKPAPGTGHCPGCASAVDAPEVVPDVALPTAPEPVAPRKPRPVGMINVERSDPRGYAPIRITLAFLAYNDTTKVYLYPMITRSVGELDYEDDSLRVDAAEFIAAVIDAKKEIEDALPGIIWIDIPTSLKMYLEDLAKDAGLSLTF